MSWIGALVAETLLGEFVVADGGVPLTWDRDRRDAANLEPGRATTWTKEKEKSPSNETHIIISPY